MNKKPKTTKKEKVVEEVSKVENSTTKIQEVKQPKNEVKVIQEVPENKEVSTIADSVEIRKNESIKPVLCNIVFDDNGKVITPKDMVLYDYYVDNGKYYFSTSVNGQTVVVEAANVIKEKCEKSELSKAFQFAKDCRSLKVAPVVKKVTTTAVKKESEQARLIKLEIVSAKNSLVDYEKALEDLDRALEAQRSQVKSFPRFLNDGRKCTHSSCPEFSETTGFTAGNNRSIAHKKACKDQSKIKTSRFYRALSDLYEIRKKIAHEEGLKEGLEQKLIALNTQLLKYQ